MIPVEVIPKLCERNFKTKIIHTGEIGKEKNMFWVHLLDIFLPLNSQAPTPCEESFNWATPCG